MASGSYLQRAQQWESAKKWRAANPEKYLKSLRAGQAQWARNNRELCCSYTARWREKNKDKVKAQCQRRRARLYGVISTLTVDEWGVIVTQHGSKCAYCRKPISGFDLTQDHIIPLVRGGPHTKENVVPSCRSCNSGKGIRV